MKTQFRSIIICVLAALTLQTCIRDEVLSPPVIAALSKNKWTSGEVLPINGSNFDPSSTKVVIDDEEVTIAGPVTNTSVTVIVPPTTEAKTASLFVRTKYGTSATVEITIHPPLPAISKIIPDKAGVGRKVKIYGSSFESVSEVTFKSGANPQVNASFVKTHIDTLLVTIPGGVGVDACDITLVSENGSSAPASFTILRAPVIDSFTPNSGLNGSLVQVNGQFFLPLIDVKIGNQKLEVIQSSSTAIVARINANVLSDTIQVSTMGGDTKAASKFNITPAPVITAIDKTSAPAGSEINITGQFFAGAFDVRFGDIVAEIVSNSGTVIKVKVPAGVVTGKISITSAAGTGVSPMDFVVSTGPIISEFTPTSGVVGNKITITGLNFGSATNTPHSVNLGALALTNVVWSDNKIEGIVPSGAVTGKLIVSTPNGTFESSSNFVIAGSPQVLGFSPASGVPGTTVTITGVNMGTTPDVRFNGIKATAIAKATPTEIICTVPAGATTGKISVNSALSSNTFTVASAPVITSIMPARGPVNAEVTISGSYLAGSTVRFANSVTATKVTDTDSQLKVKVPSGAVTGKITITNSIGTTTSASNFEVLSAPTLASFAPTSGVVGSQVTITGTNLQYNPVVRFGAIVASTRSVSATQVVVDVPVGAIDGKISITTDGTLTPVVSAGNFDVISAPVINSFAPATGTTGATIAINGTDFNNLLSITFDGVVVSTFVSKSAAKIEFVIPTLPAMYNHSVNVSVKTTVGTSSNATFAYIGPPIGIYPTPGSNPLGWALVIYGQNFSAVNKIVINGAVAPIDYRNGDVLATRVPSTAGIGPGSLKMYYTAENFVSTDFTVLSAPPPGVFPPPLSVFPPPPPPGYVPVAVNANWPDAYEPLHWFRIDAFPGSYVADEFGNPISYNSTGSFRIVEHYDGVDQELQSLLEGRTGNGSWNRASIQFSLDGQLYTGQYNSGFQMVFTNQDTGHQLVLGSPCPNFPSCKQL